jgi:ankyrin repeat protein
MPPTPTEDEADEVLLAARYGDLEDVRAFADAFGPAALAAARDANGNSALHMAAANGHVGWCADLLSCAIALTMRRCT